MSASLYNPSASVFWPLDCKESGYAFGWCNNNQNVGCIVVAGVIQLHTVDSKLREGLPKLLEHTQQHTDIADLGELQLIGKCTFYSGQRKGLVAPELEMGFYLMDSLGLDIDAFNVTSSSTVRPISGRKSSGISQHVVNQLNVASIINAAILDSLSSMSNATPSSTNLRQTTKSITARTSDLLETAISKSQSFISMPIQVICNIHVSAKYLLKDVSLSVQQMDVRADQSAALLRQMAALQPRREVWLILNDVTIGYAFGKFLCENDEVLSGMLKDANSLISWPQRALCWLDSWPAGLKLNTELSRFYSGTFVDFVDIWGGVLRHTIFPQLPNIIYIFGLISSFGALIAVLVYERALWGLGSLWRLFRGKRFNVLRNRTDSWEYDIDQLLFGTILFTLLAFLFPTVLAYYALFALLRLATILIQASLEIQLAFMNHFPLFALVLKLKDPWRLPGGLYFDFVRVLVHVNEHEAAGAGTDEQFITTLIPIVENQPVTLGRIFFQYARLWTKLASHYDPFRLFKSLLLGRFLVPIPSFAQYAKLGGWNACSSKFNISKRCCRVGIWGDIVEALTVDDASERGQRIAATAFRIDKPYTTVLAGCEKRWTPFFSGRYIIFYVASNAHSKGAVRIRSALRFCSLKDASLLRGMYKTFIAQMSRMGKKLVRVESIFSKEEGSGTGLASPSKMPSEIATMRYLKRHSAIPVPEIYGYDNDADRRVGGTWMVMEYVEGRNVDQVWHTLTTTQREQLALSLADLWSQLILQTFDRIGSLYERPEGQFVVGPMTFLPTRNHYAIAPPENAKCGPFNTALEWLEASARQDLAYRLSLSPQSEAPSRIDSVLKFIRDSDDLRLSTEWAASRFSIEHVDYSTHNVLVSSTSEGAHARQNWLSGTKLDLCNRRRMSAIACAIYESNFK
ncbi:hypothetical protein GGU10DRAFT_332375 [Lentinula aff. detonsa]|uniref:Aminoglycoside phosphotransferase domain-containing protein n=1 Tax=Lentinula aff. detonsa TaxID=2804958 RepID=A0AA38NJY3_9AGAR|nr:hypothetical protein GGU10DRAFT_332375 [Lentinula aff. detonsa]